VYERQIVRSFSLGRWGNVSLSVPHNLSVFFIDPLLFCLFHRISNYYLARNDALFGYETDDPDRTSSFGPKRINAVRFVSLSLPPRFPLSPLHTAPIIFARFCVANDDCHHRFLQTTVAPLAFNTLLTTDDEDAACGAESYLNNLGTVQRKYIRVKNGVERKRRRKGDSFDSSSSSAAKAVYEAAKKATTLSHQTGYVSPAHSLNSLILTSCFDLRAAPPSNLR
jgi:hypothetical protein